MRPVGRQVHHRPARALTARFLRSSLSNFLWYLLPLPFTHFIMQDVLLDCTPLGKDGTIVAVDCTSSPACNTVRAGYGLQDTVHLECTASWSAEHTPLRLSGLDMACTITCGISGVLQHSSRCAALVCLPAGDSLMCYIGPHRIY